MAVQTFLVLAIVGTFALNKSFVTMSVEGAETLSCTCESNTLDCQSKNLTIVPDLSDRSLVLINLQKNNLARINEMDFADLTSLRTLLLSENRISLIEEGSFGNLVQLNTLDLSSNRLLFLKPTHFIRLGNLVTLLIGGNVDLSIDPCIFFNLQSLTTLDIRNTKVDLNEALVTGVACTGASLSFPYVENLNSLSIGYEGTSSNASVLQKFPSLRGIILNWFSTASFDKSDISTLSKLTTLTLIAVDVYPREFLKSTSLTALTISESTFSCLPKNAFYNLHALEKLVIIRNTLVFIDRQAFAGGDSLTFINLAFNRLVYLPEGIFDDLGNSTFFPQTNLHSNSWRCDCNIKWMQTFEPLGGNLLFCDTPTVVRGMSIFSVNLECNSNSEELTSGELQDEFCSTSSPVDVVTQPKKASSPTKPPPTNQSSIVTYVAAAAAVTLISVIILLIIAIVFVNKKMKIGPPLPPPSRRTTFTSSVNGGTRPERERDDDEYSYDEPPTGLPSGLDIVEGPPQRRNYVDIEGRPNLASHPDYANTRHERLHSLELRMAMAGRGNGVESNSDLRFYANSAPKNPHHPRPPR